MKLASLFLIAAVELGSPFGNASATTESIEEDTILVELEVEVRGSAQAVVAHIGLPGEPELVFPLLDRGGGVYGIRTELARRDYTVVFELIGGAGVGTLSEGASLTRLGAVLSEPPGLVQAGEDEEGLSEGTQRIGWLALALGAASLSALAFWALGSREGRRTEHSEEE